MRIRSIVTKIVISVCGIVSVLLLAGALALISFEADLVERFTSERLEKINHTIDQREEDERVSLEKNVKFNTDILSGVSVRFLDTYDKEGLRQTLYAYMRYPDIIAVQVTDEDGEPFASAWKSPDIITGESLPNTVDLNEALSVQANAVMFGKKWGKLRVYYTDAMIKERIKALREKALTEAEQFRNNSRKYMNRAVMKQIIGIIFILLILIASLILSLRALVLNPLKMVSDTARGLAMFDLSVNVVTNREDEIGTLLKALSQMVSEFRNVLGHVKSGGQDLSRGSDQMRENISAIASAAEEISVNIRHIFETAEDMVQSNIIVAGSIEEMSASMNEVSVNAYQGSRITEDAVAMADKARETMRSLDEAADEINEVTEVIKRIAEKTTLLALNADIEAASAGDAGKGFAVVANEIKEFARQSTHAAEDIAARILAMQKKTDQAVTAIGDVSGIINTINHSSETISVALENQMATASNMASGAGEANTRARNIADLMEEVSKGAEEVSMRVGLAARGDKEGTDAHYIGVSAEELSRLAKILLDLVDRFKIK